MYKVQGFLSLYPEYEGAGLLEYHALFSIYGYLNFRGDRQ